MGKVEDLEKRIEQLEAQLEAAKPKPEPPPFVPKPHQHWDPTQAMSPPVRLTGREVYKKQSIEEANMEYSKDKNPVAATIPVDSKRPGQDLADAIAQGFANREKAEELAKLIDVANKLKGL